MKNDVTHSTYAFEDMDIVISHPALGQLTLLGQGVGSITFAYTNNLREDAQAADGSVMTSKIIATAGTITITVNQTAAANEWLKKLANYLVEADSSEFTSGALYARNRATGETWDCKGVGPQKRPDGAYAAQGGQVSWVLMAQEIVAE